MSYRPHTVSTVVMKVAAESPRGPDLLSCSLQEAEEQMERINREYPEVLMKLEKQKLELASKTWSLSNLERHIESMRCTAACRKERLEPLHLAMDKLSFANNAYRDNATKHSFLEEQEIDYRRLNFKMKHGRKSLQIERRLLREIKTKEGKDRNTTNSWSPLEDIESKIRGAQYMLIRSSTDMATGKDGAGDQELRRQLKQLEMEREKVVANCVVGGKIWSSLGSRKTIKEYIEAEHKEAEDSKEDRRRLQVEIKSVGESLKRLEEGHSSVQSQLNHLRTRKQQVREQILDLKKQLARRPTKKKRKERVKTSKTNQL